jgi:ABC-type protease/lipase transport system fused ATPase/permease subunit
MRDFAAKFRVFFFYAGLFSLVINVLMLVPALFMLQVFDRVIISRSTETLVMLTALAVGALLSIAHLDVIRSQLLTRVGVALEKLLGPRVLSDMIERNARPGARELPHGLRDVNILRGFLTGPGIIALFDAPWVPIYVLIISLFHPLLGVIALGGATALLLLAYLNEKLTRQPLEAMQLESRRAARFVDRSLANAEVAGALGIIDNLTRGWQLISRGVLSLQLDANRTSSLLTSVTRFMRQALQIAVIAASAWLVIEQKATSGVMIAATVLLGRALAPVESAIAG